MNSDVFVMTPLQGHRMGTDLCVKQTEFSIPYRSNTGNALTIKWHVQLTYLVHSDMLDEQVDQLYN